MYESLKGRKVTFSLYPLNLHTEEPVLGRKRQKDRREVFTQVNTLKHSVSEIIGYVDPTSYRCQIL